MIDPKQKRIIAQHYRWQLRKVAQHLGLRADQYILHSNPGGPGVWGEVILHTDKYYLQASQDQSDLGLLVRSCKGRKDYTGGPNQWVPFTLLERPQELAAMLKALRI
jgi:hypothetical protein